MQLGSGPPPSAVFGAYPTFPENRCTFENASAIIHHTSYEISRSDNVIVKDTNCACDGAKLDTELITCKENGRCMFCGECRKVRKNHATGCGHNPSAHHIVPYPQAAVREIERSPYANPGIMRGPEIGHIPETSEAYRNRQMRESATRQQYVANARNFKAKEVMPPKQTIADWFKFRPRRIEELDSSKPLKPVWTDERILDVISELTPSLSGAALMCPRCFKQMRSALLFNHNKDAVIFSLNCCFGQATMATVARTQIEQEARPLSNLAEYLANSTQVALFNLRQNK